MNADQRLLVIGIYINASLYLAGVFIAGFITHNSLSWELALTTAGLSYVAYALQVGAPKLRHLSAIIVLTTVVTGAVAGLSLLW